LQAFRRCSEQKIRAGFGPNRLAARSVAMQTAWHADGSWRAGFPEIARQQVVSTVIRSMGYGASHAVLEIEFISGRIYRYHMVPQRQWSGLEAAGSKGRYFDAHIREKFPTTRMT
jgi:KTSC domain